MYSTKYLRNFKDLLLETDAVLNVRYDMAENTMFLSSNKVVKNLFISSTKEYLKLSDNYFDVVPGHEVEVKVKTLGGLRKFRDSLRFLSYVQIHSKDKLDVRHHDI